MSKKLLLADDSITIQKVIGITFANEDYELSIVGDGDSALEKARAMRPDLVLADVFMPGKNGYELCAAIKQDPALKGVPVLLLAGTFEPFDEEKAIGSGADSWISKPFESQALISKVEGLLASSSAASASAAPAPAPAAAPQPAPTPKPAPVAPPQPAADPWGDVDIAFDTTDDAQIVEEAAVFEEESDFVIAGGDDSSDFAEADVWADSSDNGFEIGGIDMVESVPVVTPEPPPAPAVAMQPAPQPRPVAPAPAPAPAAAGVEARLASLSEADLQAVVERVAGAVLEKIAWEVVPDLAENLIRDEIRKIKDSAR